MKSMPMTAQPVTDVQVDYSVGIHYLADLMAREIPRWAALVKKSGASAN